MSTRYIDKSVSFLTQHGKESLVKPILEPVLNCHIVLAEGYDTDRLGTFSMEINRPASQIQTARIKARIGMELTGTSIGMASEGAFVADPFGGLMPWNIEVLIWLDDVNQVEIAGIAQGPARSLHRPLRWLHDLENFAIEAGFPEHHLILRPQSESDPRIYKGLNDWSELKNVFLACQRESSNQLVYAESDHRAFCNPTRQSMIKRAAEDLLKRIQSNCPRCSAPGFSIAGHQSGLQCRLCGHPTRLTKSRIWSCSSCQYTEQVLIQELANPAQCDACNP